MKVEPQTLKAINAFRELDLERRESLSKLLSILKIYTNQQIIAQDDTSSNGFFYRQWACMCNVVCGKWQGGEFSESAFGGHV